MRLSAFCISAFLPFEYAQSQNESALTAEEIQQLKSLLVNKEKTPKSSGKNEKTDKKGEQSDTNWKSLSKWIEDAQSKLDGNVFSETKNLFAFRLALEYLQTLLESCQNIYGFETGSINRLLKQHSVTAEKLQRRIYIYHLLYVFINHVIPILASMPQTTVITSGQIKNFMELLRWQIQGVCTEEENKILTNIFGVLQTVKDKSDSYLASTLVFSTVKIFQKLLENQVLKTDLNDYRASIRMFITEMNSIIEKIAAEQTSDKFSKDRQNITACLITAIRQMLNNIIQISKIIIDMLNQAITKIHTMQTICEEMPRQDFTFAINHEIK